MKSSLKWKPATTKYPIDHIVSSKAREVGARGFKPQYENVKHVNIRFILSNEYMRLWFKERDLYQKENYAKQENARNDVQLKRGYVQRMMTNPKQQTRELPIIHLKRFQNIIAKLDNRKTVEEKTKVCDRYKKTFVPAPLTRYKPTCAVVKQKPITTGKNVTSKKIPEEEQNANASSQKEKPDQLGKKCDFVCQLV